MAQNNQINTSTQIRNLYSEGLCYLNVSFFNTNLSFKFYPFLSKDNLGKNSYDKVNYQNTTVNYEGASALELIADLIIDGKIDEVDLPIPCAAGATLRLTRNLSPKGIMETTFTIEKNGVKIPFVFNTIPVNVKINGQSTVKMLEVGLKSFKSIITGYLDGINADRHLDKLTEDYVKSLGANNTNNNSQTANNGNFNANGNNRNNNYRKGGNNNNYRKQYNNANYNQNWNNQQQQQQDMSSYQLGN